MAQGVYMTEKELYRAEILAKVADKGLPHRKAAEMLRISQRQFQRLLNKYREHGPTSLASKKRGKKSNNRLPDELRATVSDIVLMKRYEDFGPTFMCEKLKELHSIDISKETTRQIMMSCGAWYSRRKRRPVVHQQRMRRARLGELVQVDGSHHAWFEDRGDKCCLIVFIDDATGRTYGKFYEAETTAAYMQTMCEYIHQQGVPLAVYSDKHGIFRINQGQVTRKENFTQFGRALHEMDIELIYANSPQAKGRVERANHTLQDRLLKEMRLANIRTIDEANRFLESYWVKYNERFAVLPACSEDAHRNLRESIRLDKIFCRKEERKVTKNLEFQYENVIYHVIEKRTQKSLIGAKITVIEHLDGTVTFEHDGSSIQVVRYDEQLSGVEVSTKELDLHFQKRKKHKLSYYHPWLQEGRVEARNRKYQGI